MLITIGLESMVAVFSTNHWNFFTAHLRCHGTQTGWKHFWTGLFWWFGDDCLRSSKDYLVPCRDIYHSPMKHIQKWLPTLLFSHQDSIKFFLISNYTTLWERHLTLYKVTDYKVSICWQIDEPYANFALEGRGLLCKNLMSSPFMHHLFYIQRLIAICHNSVKVPLHLFWGCTAVRFEVSPYFQKTISFKS